MKFTFQVGDVACFFVFLRFELVVLLADLVQFNLEIVGAGVDAGDLVSKVARLGILRFEFVLEGLDEAVFVLEFLGGGVAQRLGLGLDAVRLGLGFVELAHLLLESFDFVSGQTQEVGDVGVFGGVLAALVLYLVSGSEKDAPWVVMF